MPSGRCTSKARWHVVKLYAAKTGRLAEAIEQKFGVRYNRDHVGRLMHEFRLRARRFV